MGRPPIGKVAMSGAERTRIYRRKHAPPKPASADLAQELAQAKVRIAELEAVVRRTGKDGKTRKLPQRPSPSDPVQAVNAFHRELLGFLTGFAERFDRWHDAGPLLDEDGKAALMQAFYLCSDGFARLAQKLDGR
jgi:hypothetical protein